MEKLPRELNGFTLVPGSGIKGQILNIAAYVNEAMHARLDITYTSETFDYVPVKTLGLHTFRDERYFCRDREKFAGMLLEHLPELLASIDRKQPHTMDWEARALGFDKWEYWHSLPKQVGGFELFITPDNPLCYLNGSYVFLDYTDFANGHQVYFAYNIFRNEIFAEKKQHYLPLTTDVFDVQSSVRDDRKLAMLEELLAAHLDKTFAELAKK